jgi:hypothetical protein
MAHLAKVDYPGELLQRIAIATSPEMSKMCNRKFIAKPALDENI